jgi:hypothetical protein
LSCRAALPGRLYYGINNLLTMGSTGFLEHIDIGTSRASLWIT